jgi:hypothetical protein
MLIIEGLQGVIKVFLTVVIYTLSSVMQPVAINMFSESILLAPVGVPLPIDRLRPEDGFGRLYPRQHFRADPREDLDRGMGIDRRIGGPFIS